MCAQRAGVLPPHPPHHNHQIYSSSTRSQTHGRVLDVQGLERGGGGTGEAKTSCRHNRLPTHPGRGGKTYGSSAVLDKDICSAADGVRITSKRSLLMSIAAFVGICEGVTATQAHIIWMARGKGNEEVGVRGRQVAILLCYPTAILDPCDLDRNPVPSSTSAGKPTCRAVLSLTATQLAPLLVLILGGRLQPTRGGVNETRSAARPATRPPRSLTGAPSRISSIRFPPWAWGGWNLMPRDTPQSRARSATHVEHSGEAATSGDANVSGRHIRNYNRPANFSVPRSRASSVGALASLMRANSIVRVVPALLGAPTTEIAPVKPTVFCMQIWDRGGSAARALASHKGEEGLTAGGSLSGFSCWAMLLISGIYFENLLFPPPLHSSASLNNDRGETRREWRGYGIRRWEKHDNPEKTHRLSTTSATIPTCKKTGFGSAGDRIRIVEAWKPAAIGDRTYPFLRYSLVDGLMSKYDAPSVTMAYIGALFGLLVSDCWPVEATCVAVLWSRGGKVVRLLASHLGKPGSIPGGITPGFSHLDIVPYDAAGRRTFHSDAAPYPPCCILISSEDLDVKSHPDLYTHSLT
ncbi:hypothetical protein PR048_019452 [Dryococelus australis]|uniref:Uncharacterized protein n=1 Tax=Dryococelus australis TaxID=614101 RepID=A0ABQ9H3J6_9NEOP|nr:hypothetical protein PR048_019452 [Dryococelus australis]